MVGVADQAADVVALVGEALPSSRAIWPWPPAIATSSSVVSFQLGDQRVEVERSREHPDLFARRGRRRPLLARPVPVELEAVAVGIAR